MAAKAYQTSILSELARNRMNNHADNFDAVNQGAAVLMTTAAKADALGVPVDKRVYLHGYASAADVPLIERADISASHPLAAAARAAFDMAGWCSRHATRWASPLTRARG